jgi:succinate dehydrogenase / fumarate reductase iron-sulfur subunit
MSLRKITLRILRYKPDRFDPPRYQEFALKADPETTVLDALETLRLQQDPTLMYRHSCHHSSCGTCACKINGRERLACITRIDELEDSVIELAPLDGFTASGDLVVDMSPFYADMAPDWDYLKKCAKVQTTPPPEGVNAYERFEDCIECGACVSACPVTPKKNGFLGPAVLAALSAELKKSPQRSKHLLATAGDDRGERLCDRALNCSRVCPTGVYPARHIADLRKLLARETN